LKSEVDAAGSVPAEASTNLTDKSLVRLSSSILGQLDRRVSMCLLPEGQASLRVRLRVRASTLRVSPATEVKYRLRRCLQGITLPVMTKRYTGTRTVRA
jgi:hypothetical protein